MAYAAVQWCEDPPKWDVLPIKSIDAEDVPVSVGDTVTAKYGRGWFPAKIVGLGCKEEMEKTVNSINTDIESEEDLENEEENMGRGMRRKKRANAISSDEELLPSTSASSRKVEAKKLKKQLHDKQSRRVLAELQDKGCLSCETKDNTISKLEEKVSQLTTCLEKAEEELRALRALEDATSSMRNATRRLTTVVERMESAAQNAGSVPTSASVVDPSTPRSRIEYSTPRSRIETSAAGSTPTTIHEPQSQASSTSSTGPARSSASQLDLAPTSGPQDQEAEDMVNIGPSGTTKIPSRTYTNINWLGDKKKAGRDLLVAVFGREALAKSSMTGTATHNPNLGSGAAKPALDPVRLSDLIEFLVRKLHMAQSEVRTIIRSKLCDEAKLLRARMARAE